MRALNSSRNLNLHLPSQSILRPNHAIPLLTKEPGSLNSWQTNNRVSNIRIDRVPLCHQTCYKRTNKKIFYISGYIIQTYFTTSGGWWGKLLGSEGFYDYPMSSWLYKYVSQIQSCSRKTAPCYQYDVICRFPLIQSICDVYWSNTRAFLKTSFMLKIPYYKLIFPTCLWCSFRGREVAAFPRRFHSD